MTGPAKEKLPKLDGDFQKSLPVVWPQENIPFFLIKKRLVYIPWKSGTPRKDSMTGCPEGTPVERGSLEGLLVMTGSKGGHTMAPKSVFTFENTSPRSAFSSYHFLRSLVHATFVIACVCSRRRIGHDGQGHGAGVPRHVRDRMLLHQEEDAIGKDMIGCSRVGCNRRGDKRMQQEMIQEDRLEYN